MGTSIEKKITSLSIKKQKEFSERLMDVLHDRYWFETHEMHYANPNVKQVKKILFREEYTKYLSY